METEEIKEIGIGDKVMVDATIIEIRILERGTTYRLRVDNDISYSDTFSADRKTITTITTNLSIFRE